MADKVKQDNTYLKHIEDDDWNDMHLYHVESQAVWRNVAVLAIIALALVSLYAIYIVNQDKHTALIFEKDNSNNIIALGIATRTLSVDNKVVAHQLLNFITSLREVPEDVWVKRRNIDIVHKMIDPKLQKPIDQMIIDQYNRAKIVMVTVKSIRPMPGGSSWEVTWSETYQDDNGSSSQHASGFSSIITFKKMENIPLNIQLVNPIGLFINYIHPVQDVGS